MAYKDILFEKKDRIAYITLNRPEKLNTLSDNIQKEMDDALLRCWDDDGVGAIIIRGAGRAFCAGFDVSEPGIDTLGQADAGPKTDDTDTGIRQNRHHEPWARYTQIFNQKKGIGNTAMDWSGDLWQNPKVTIAQVQGFCLGAGLWLASTCDLMVCSEDALFAYPPIRYGSSVIFDILQPWFLGVRKLREMAFTGNMIDSHDAYNCGLVNRIVPADQLAAEAERLAHCVARIPYPANTLSKMAINKYVDTTLGRFMGIPWAQALNQMMEGSSAPGNIWTSISQQSRSAGGAGKMFGEIRSKFAVGDQLAIENAKKFSQKK